MNQSLMTLLIPPGSLAELDVPQGLLMDLVLRLIFVEGDTPVARMEQVLRVPFKVLDDLLLDMQSEHLVEVPGATSRIGRRAYIYRLTDEGKARARDSMERSQYVGPLPVPLAKYNKAILLQSQRSL
ncbi:MAG: hypothetical protein ACP5R2_07825, partial [Anaerolineae bacterium]